MSKKIEPEENEMIVHFNRTENKKTLPVERESTKSFLNLTALIRSIQRHDGHEPCFRTGRKECTVTDCNWRSHCIDDQSYLKSGVGDN